MTLWNANHIILNCYIQIKVSPPIANDLNQLRYLRFAPPRRFWPLPRPEDFEPCFALPRHGPKDFDPCPAPQEKTLPRPSLIRLINGGIVIGVENVLPKPLSWRCTNFATVGRSHFYKKNWEFCEKLFPKPTSQMTHMFYSHRRKDLQTQDCDICGKYFTKTTVTMMHKFHHIEAKPSLEGELRVLWKIVPKTNLPDELHVY